MYIYLYMHAAKECLNFQSFQAFAIRIYFKVCKNVAKSINLSFPQVRVVYQMFLHDYVLTKTVLIFRGNNST